MVEELCKACASMRFDMTPAVSSLSKRDDTPLAATAHMAASAQSFLPYIEHMYMHEYLYYHIHTYISSVVLCIAFGPASQEAGFPGGQPLVCRCSPPRGCADACLLQCAAHHPRAEQG